MSFLLDIAYAIGAIAASPVWGISMLRTGKWRTDWPARFGRVPKAEQGDRVAGVEQNDGVAGAEQSDAPKMAEVESPFIGNASANAQTILIHAVSVGEVNAIRNLVDEIETTATRTGRAIRIVISVTTDTGTARARSLFADRLEVVRYPFDFSFAIRRFLNAVQPDLVALVENEVWPNFTAICRKRKIPLAIVNGRLTERSFRGYKRLLPIARRMYGRLSLAAMQDDQYARRINQLGLAADRIVVTDTMKWDTANIADQVDGADQLADELGLDRNRPIIVAGSTAPGEDKLLIETCPIDAQLVIVPRKPEWFDQVPAVCRQLGLTQPVVRRTEHPSGTRREIDNSRIFLLDTMGELRKAYALADVAIVGRSFLGLYGSDMMEPVALGKPTIVGPYHSDFAQTVKALTTGDGLIVTDQPGQAAAELLHHRSRARELAENGRQVIRRHQGATARTCQLLMNLLPIADDNKQQETTEPTE